MKLKKKVKKILSLLVICSLIAYLSFAIMWAQDQDSKAVCKGVDISIINATDSSIFITPIGIFNELKAMKLDPTGQKIASINTLKIEAMLNKLDYFEDAQCVINNNSKLRIEVKQILPVMRFFDNRGKSFYINKDGKKMEANARFRINVPIITGNFDETTKPTSIIPLIDYIAQNDVLSTYVTMINVKDKNNIYIIPNIDGHVVNLGNIENLDSKFSKLKLMYRDVLPVKGWYTYDTISVKWDHQIVATKRNKAVAVQMEYDAQDDEPDADIGTMETNSPPISAAINDAHSVRDAMPQSVAKEKVEKGKAEKPKEVSKKTEKKKENIDKKKSSKPTKSDSNKGKNTDKKTTKKKANEMVEDAFSKKASPKNKAKN